jgi:SAM-dependent methyltransferase
MRICVRCDHRFEASGWKCPSCGFDPPADGFVRLAADVREAYPEDAVAAMPELEERSFWFAARNELILWALDRHFPAASSFLEIGCGTGFVLRALRARRPQTAFVGLDVSPGALGAARSRLPDVELLQVDARDLPFEREFDAVGAFDVLEHEPDDAGALAAIATALKPAGGLLVTVPQHPRLWSAVDDFSHHVRRYTRSELVAKVERAGFEVLDVTSFVSLLLPVLAVSRLRHRRDVEYDAATEYRIPAPIERGFTAAMTLERGLIRAGLRLPAGGSLLLAARLRTAP